MKYWRLIPLLNVDYKVLAKTLPNRIRNRTGKVMHPDQTCGIPSRAIYDILFTQVVIILAKKKTDH